MNKISQIWKEILRGENIDLYLTIGAAIILSALSLAGWNVGDKIAGVTLAVLALLAITNLVNRHKFEEVLKQELGTSFFTKSFPEDTLREDFKQAKEIWLIGRNLGQTAEVYKNIFEGHLANGGKINALLVNPDNDQSMEYIHKSLSNKRSLKSLKEEIYSTIEMLQGIAEGKESNLEIRLIDQPIAFGGRAVDMKSLRGRIYINLYKYKIKLDGRICFVLTPKDDLWYEVYQEQILALWKDAKPCKKL